VGSIARTAWRSSAILVVAITCAAVPALADKPQIALEKSIPVKVTAIPIDFDRDNPARKEFDKLIYRGGLNLFANSSFFGGYSAMALDPSGTFLLAISDSGTWLRAKLDYDGRTLKGLSGVTLGPLLGRDGKPLLDDQERDSEGMMLIEGDPSKGTAYVSFERHHRIDRYPFEGDRFGPPIGSVPLPASTKRMSRNSGLEAIVLMHGGRLKGTLVAFAESLTDKNGNLQGWLLGGSKPGSIAVKRIGGFDITDAAELPDGGLILLERRFRYSEGVKMRLRRVAASEIKPGAVIQGEVLLEATDALNIDNMEAVAVHRRVSGETVITIMSDDNFSGLQRTLIMQFALPGGEPIAAGAPAN
jgi:hypothetical protein